MINPSSPEWIEVLGFISTECKQARIKLESLGCDERTADQMRGIIDVLDRLEKLATPAPKITNKGYSEFV